MVSNFRRLIELRGLGKRERRRDTGIIKSSTGTETKCGKQKVQKECDCKIQKQ
jgi:hypothetical protein